MILSNLVKKIIKIFERNENRRCLGGDRAWYHTGGETLLFEKNGK